MTDPQVGVVITLKDIYTAVQNQTTELARFAGQLQLITAAQDQATKERASLEQRLSALERWRLALPGALFLGSCSAAAAAGAWVTLLHK